MSWTVPRTWVTAELVTAALGNTHWRDNLNFLFSVQVAAVVKHSTSQSITASAALAFDGEEDDLGGMHDNATNNSRLTVPSAGGGRYNLSTQFRVSALGTSTAQAYFRKNGATQLHDGVLLQGLANVVHTMTLLGVALVATDYVEVWILKGDGSNWDFGAAAGGARNQFSAIRIGA